MCVSFVEVALGCRVSAIIYRKTWVYGDYQWIIAINASARPLTLHPNATPIFHPPLGYCYTELSWQQWLGAPTHESLNLFTISLEFSLSGLHLNEDDHKKHHKMLRFKIIFGAVICRIQNIIQKSKCAPRFWRTKVWINIAHKKICGPDMIVRLSTQFGRGIFWENIYICIFWVVSSSLIAVCADTFWVGDIKTLLVKVLIYLVPGGSQADLFEVSWESESAHFSRLARQSRARICAIQSLNWRLGCTRDFTNECIKVKFNEKYRERVCTEMQRTFKFPCFRMSILNILVLHNFLWFLLWTI